MKNIMPIHIILCGLLSSITIASERYSNSSGAIVSKEDAFTMIRHEIANEIQKATMSQSSEKAYNNSPMAIDIPITKPKRSFSSGISPKTREILSPRNSSSGSFTSLSSSYNNTQNTPPLNKFYVNSNEDHWLMGNDGRICDYAYITKKEQQEFRQKYETELIIKNNESFIRIISYFNSQILFSEEYQSKIKIEVTKEQIEKLKQLFQDNKNILTQNHNALTHDKSKQNLYYINSIQILMNDEISTSLDQDNTKK